MPILSEEDLERFRTKVCTLASSMKCDFGVERCNYSHNLYWARRCPFYLRDSSILRYIPACCPDVELGEGTKVLHNTCPRGNNCSFAHSLEEMNYHPLVYKTDICKDYRLGKCRTYYCHLVHGLAEFRVPREFVLPRKKGLNIPIFKHVTTVDNIRNFQGGQGSSGYQTDRHLMRPFQKQDEYKDCERDVFGKIKDLGTSWSPVNWNSSEYLSVKNVPKNGISSFDNITDENASSSRRVTERKFNITASKIEGYQQQRPEKLNKFNPTAENSDSVSRWYKKSSGALACLDADDNGENSIAKAPTNKKNNPKIKEMSTIDKIGSSLKGSDFLPSETMVVRNVSMWKNIEDYGALTAFPKADYRDYENRVQTLQLYDNDTCVQSNPICENSLSPSTLVNMCRAISQQCDVIKERCHTIAKGHNISWTSVVRETQRLWQLVMDVKTILYGQSPIEPPILDLPNVTVDVNPAYQISKQDNPFESSWSSLSIFYSEILEAFESESLKGATSDLKLENEVKIDPGEYNAEDKEKKKQQSF